MVSIMLISENQRETQVLKLAFEQKSIKIISSTVDYSNYVKILQYLPDVILVELPRTAHQQLHFTEMLRRHKKTKHIPIIGYGDKVDEGVKKGLLCKGIYHYLDRPLRFSVLLDIIIKILKKLNKDAGIAQEQAADKDKDMALLLDKETLPMKKIEIMTAYVAKLMAFPFTVAKVLQLADSEKSAAADLAKVIQADPVISAQLLKISNSVLFASLNRKIGSVKDAIIRVGFRETKRLVMSMSVMTLFGDKDKNLGFDRAAFWHHSLVCGIISERMARHMGTVSTEEAFLAGILHDFGMLLLDEFFPAIFSRILEDTAAARTQFVKTEKTLLGVTHNDMVADLFAKWKLPDAVSEGVVSQYQIRDFNNVVDTPGKKIALCVGLSDMLAKASGLGRECDQFVSRIDNWAFEQVRMPAGITPAFLEDITTQMKLYREFLKLKKQESARNAEDGKEAEKIRIGVLNSAKDLFVPPLLYLRGEGYTVNLVGPEALDALNGTLHCLIVWAVKDLTEEALGRVSRITKWCEQPPAGGQSPGLAPVLVFLDETAPLHLKKDVPEHITLMNASFDLRELDAPVLNAVDGTMPIKGKKNSANGTSAAHATANKKKAPAPADAARGTPL